MFRDRVCSVIELRSIQANGRLSPIASDTGNENERSEEDASLADLGIELPDQSTLVEVRLSNKSAGAASAPPDETGCSD